MAKDHDWRKRITDEKERRVFEALSDTKWEFRTVAGLAEDVGIPESEVRAILGKYPDLVRKPLVPDRQGRELFTLRSRGVTFQEVLSATRTAIVKS